MYRQKVDNIQITFWGYFHNHIFTIFYSTAEIVTRKVDLWYVSIEMGVQSTQINLGPGHLYLKSTF